MTMDYGRRPVLTNPPSAMLFRPGDVLSDTYEVTELLGDHQDAHVAQTIIRELASHDGTDGLTGMSLGLLYEFESEEEILDRLRFIEMWPRARRSARRAGMR